MSASANKSDPQHGNTSGQEIKNKIVFSRRVAVAMLAIVTGMVGLIARTFHLQVQQHSYYRTRSHKNRVKLQIIPPLRGNIYDRNGIALSKNTLSYDLIVNRSKSENYKALVNTINQYIRFNDTDQVRYNKELRQHNINQDIVVRADLTEHEFNVFAVNLHKFPGFEIVPSFKRHYPHGKLTAHVVGYINRINAKDLEKVNKKAYKGTTKIGRTGIEKFYEDTLHGTAGFQQAEVTRTGKVVRIMEKQDPIPGEDLYLSLDLRLQQIISEHIEEHHHNGAGVAIDPRNGEVLAMYSNPSFDANLFVEGISHNDYNKLINSPRKDLFNRALNGQYSPASTIKPMMALAALHNYIATEQTTIKCTGSYKIPEVDSKKRFFCWKRSGHGDMNAYSSIVQSCDVYYYTLGKELGIARMHEYLSQFGLGELTGIDLPNESTGNLPNKAWKEKKYNKPWFIGDTVNASIGQGYMLATPLQLAYFTAILAAKGKRFKPHFVTHTRSVLTGKKEPHKSQQLASVEQDNPSAWDEIHRSLIGVMKDKKGTGRKISTSLPFDIAGKTGTAQVFSFRNNQRIKRKDLEKKLHDNSVFIAYAPADKPQIAIAVILENAGGGSEAAAPVASKILESYFNSSDSDITKAS